MTEQDRSLTDRLTEAATLWQATRALAEHWRAGRPDDPARAQAGQAYETWSATVQLSKLHFLGDRGPNDFSAEDRDFLVRQTADGGEIDLVDAAGWGMAQATSHTLVAGWRAEIGGDRHVLADGELYPVADAPWEVGPFEHSPRPQSLTPPAPGELPWVRAHDASRCEVTVDFSLAPALEQVLTSLDFVACAQPNEAYDELDFPRTGQQYFPVGPADDATQLAVVRDLVRRVCRSGASVAVFPELCLAPGHVDELRAQLRAEDDVRLIVVGSVHDVIDGQPENVAYGLLAGYDEQMVHHKSLPFSDELRMSAPEKEGIAHRARPSFTVWQADRFRVAIAICKELLDEDRAALYDRLGVNTLLVPALSMTTQPFVGAAAARVSAAQALTVVANGPRCDRNGDRIEPDYVVGQPIAGREAAAFVEPTDAPTIAELKLPW